MASTTVIKEKFERNARVVELRPERGRYTSVTKVRLRDGLTCDIEAGSWKLVADMGRGSGGEEQGPTPGGYGRAALGSCLAPAIAQWAAMLDVPLDDVVIEVQSDADAAGAVAARAGFVFTKFSSVAKMSRLFVLTSKFRLTPS